MIQILYASLFFAFAIPTFILGFYGLILLYYYKVKTEGERDEYIVDSVFEPLVSVVTATHDEEMVIAKKIENVFASNYPLDKLEVIFVDDSNDSTPQIIKDYSRKYSLVKLSFR